MKENLFERIRQIVKQIPEGKVATYGQIGKILGIKNARIVGYAMRQTTDESVPCHRVLKVDGGLCKSNPEFMQEQRFLLLKEGVGFRDEMHVDLEKFRWKK
jgi:methylated-DNA-protein-cysteine methyltransferase-like protein